ncbi:MAG: transcriptional repressor LexA [Alphaproteobacteria bacterium]
MTNKAKKLFDFIQSYIQKNGIAPSFNEMKNFMGLKSKSSIFQYLDYLQENKYIERDKLKSRSIKLKNVIPLYPEISAGKPLDTDLANMEYIQLDHLIKNKSKNSFACKVNGESMNSYGIQSGDIVILDSSKSYKKNDICAVQIDNSEISLKKIELLKENIKIYGDNDNFNPITIKKERIKIIARMIGLIRNY